jgi:hypothetical protein
VVVNFHGDLVELIRETRYLDRMGFAIPEIALNVALQVCVWVGSVWVRCNLNPNPNANPDESERLLIRIVVVRASLSKVHLAMAT